MNGGGASMAERNAADIRLMDAAYTRWADLPPATVTLDRSTAWSVLLALQATITHPALAGTAMGAAVEGWGRQLQEAVCDDVEVYTTAERGWDRKDSGPAPAPDSDPDPAGVSLMTDAYIRWSTMPQVSATAERRDTWVVMMALQLAVTHPAVGKTPIGPVVTAVGRALQGGLCDDPELYALAEAGWDRTADVDRGSGL